MASMGRQNAPVSFSRVTNTVRGDPGFILLLGNQKSWQVFLSQVACDQCLLPRPVSVLECFNFCLPPVDLCRSINISIVCNIQEYLNYISLYKFLRNYTIQKNAIFLRKYAIQRCVILKVKIQFLYQKSSQFICHINLGFRLSTFLKPYFIPRGNICTNEAAEACF